MMEKMRKGSDDKREMALMHVRKRLGLLEDLKEVGGPFTSAEQVESFLTNSADEKKKKRDSNRRSSTLGTPPLSSPWPILYSGYGRPCPLETTR